jgi:hypothetical protein
MEGEWAFFSLEGSKSSKSLRTVDSGCNPIDRLGRKDHELSLVQGLLDEGSMFFFKVLVCLEDLGHNFLAQLGQPLALRSFGGTVTVPPVMRHPRSKG